MRRISLTQDQWALVDEDDWERLKGHSWRYHKGYAVRDGRDTLTGKRTFIFMHHEVMGMAASRELMVDHVNRNRTDNRRVNLRLANAHQNNCNRSEDVNSSSRFKGVSWRSDRNKWRAQIQHNGKKRHIGLFDSEIEAAIAYNQAARRLFGEYAVLNTGVSHREPG